jgi:hypothetical protein
MEAIAVEIGKAFLNSAVDILIKEFGSPLVRGFFKRRKLDKELLERLTETLNVVNGLLIDAEEKQITVDAVKNWHDDIKDAVYEAEDLLDEIDYEAGSSDQVEAGSQTRTAQMRNLLFCCISPFSKNLENEELAENLKKIFERLERLERKATTIHLITRVGVKRSGDPQPRSLPTTSLLDSSSVYVRVDEKQAMTDLLLSDDAKMKDLEVIPIVGMGGIGKTTFAMLVYNDEAVQKWFDLKTWAHVSQEFDPLTVTTDIFKGVGLSDCEKMTDDQIHWELKRKVTGKKLLLVLDDVWSDDQAKWDFLLTPLQSGARGSKIVVTTRNKNIMSALQIVSPYPLQRMSDDDCWSLFSRYAFGGQHRNATSQFEETFRSEIVRKCDGLPLAARSLGSLLKSQTDVKEWTEILKSNVWNQHRTDGLHVLPALRVSYDHLPSYLKRCFAYSAILPKGHVFTKEELVLLWMAEGFIVHHDGSMEMKLGYEYFQDLVSRSFFEQIDDHFPNFVMHDLTNDLAKHVCGGFSFSLDDDGNDSHEISSKTRYLSYAITRYEALKSVRGINEVQNLRTFMSMSKRGWSNGGFNSEEIHNLLPRFKRLRVLSLSGYDNVCQLLDSIGNLKHLRFLNLSRTSMDRLPEVLCASYNLQTLILCGCKNLVELPTKMKTLTNLYHLNITETILQEMPPQIGKLRRLQLLTDFFVGTHESSNIKELGELEYLEGELRIWNLQNVLDAQDASDANLGGKRNLKALSLVWSVDTGNPPHEQGIIERLQPHKDVEKLSIAGYGGEILPKWVGDSNFSKLEYLSLDGFKCCRFLPPLGQLSSLRTLLIKAWYGVEVIGHEFYGRCISTNNPFESLRILIFERMQQWHEWKPDDDSKAFPRLEVLQIRECPKLRKALPCDLPSLMELEIKECPQLVLSLPSSPTINKMMLSNDSAVVKLEKLTSGYSLKLFSFQALHSLPKKMEKLGCDSTTLLNMDILGVSIKWLPLPLFPRLKQLNIGICSDLESLCVQEEPCSNSESTCSSLMCQSPHLEKLSLHSCLKLKSIHCSFPSLVKLKIYRCDEIESFPGLSLSSKLESLKIQGCKKMLAGRMQWNLQRFPSLSRFCFGACEEVKSFPEEGMLLPSTLTSLGIQYLPNLKSLDCKRLQHLTSLRELIIKYCSKLQPIPEGSLSSSVAVHTMYCPLME